MIIRKNYTSLYEHVVYILWRCGYETLFQNSIYYWSRLYFGFKNSKQYLVESKKEPEVQTKIRKETIGFKV